MNELNDKVTRVEVIDYTGRLNSAGRLLVKYGQFEFSLQDDGTTLKIFMTKEFCNQTGCESQPEVDAHYCSNHAPYLKSTSDKPTERVGGIKIN